MRSGHVFDVNIILRLSLLKREIQTFNNFVKIKEAEEKQKQRQQNSYKSIFH